MLEGPNDAGFLGQEVYGAGFTFRAHLMWDSRAHAENRDVMVVSSDGYREREAAARGDRRFLAFNGGADPVETMILFPGAGPGTRIRVEGPRREPASHDLGSNDSVPLRLAPAEWVSLVVSPA
jgi:hypothetical protein